MDKPARYFVTTGAPDALEVVATGPDSVDLIEAMRSGQTLWKAEATLDVPRNVLNELQEACGYDPEGDTGVDSLISYKDACEDLVYTVQAVLTEAIKTLGAAIEQDGTYWETLACGQDTEQAEATGALTGYSDALEAVEKLLRGDTETIDSYVRDAAQIAAGQYAEITSTNREEH